MYFRRGRINMAKRKTRGKKIQPSVMKMNFAFTITRTGKESRHIDLSQCASLVNRRFYRQGLNWAVAGFKLTTAATAGQISLHKLPNTWVMSNAWEKSFRTWQKMNTDALDEVPSIKPKFLDFKIFANADHHENGSGKNLLPHSAATIAAGIQTAQKGEWEYSKIVVPNTAANAPGTRINNFEFIAVGPNYPGASSASSLDAVSLIDGYAASRGLPNIVDPNAPDDSADADGATPENWMVATFNDATGQDDAVISDMITENNLSPYPFENDGTNTDTMYPGGANQLNSLEIHDQEFVTTTTVGGKTYLQGGNFPCGLIEVSTAGFAANDALLLEVTMVPGTHRGYLAEPMTEM